MDAVKIRTNFLNADVGTALNVGTDRAGNAQLMLRVELLPGTHLGAFFRPQSSVPCEEKTRRLVARVLSEAVTVYVVMDPHQLATLCRKAQTSNRRTSRRGPLRAVAVRAVPPVNEVEN